MKRLEDYLPTRDGGHVLDIACGSGNFTRRLINELKSYTSITGLDIKPDLKDDFLKNTEGHDITFVVAPIAEFLKIDNTFDTISISNALHHVEQVADIMSNFKHISHSDGVVIITEMCSDCITPAQENQRDLHHFMARLHSAMGEHHRETFSRNEIHAMIENAGLKIQHAFEAKNDDAPVQTGDNAASRFTSRIQSAIENVYPNGLPADLRTELNALKTSTIQNGIAPQPQLTFVCQIS